MLTFAPLSVLILAVSTVSGLVIPRDEAPATWNDSLEKYDIYHNRYQALGCQNNHGTPFFDTCCHPLSKYERLEDRPAECRPSTPAYVPEPVNENKPASPVTGAVVELADVSNSDYQNGGFATFYYQNGNAGACGQRHGDYELIAAMDYRRYGNTSVKSKLCGQHVEITNTKNHKTVRVLIADACPSCKNRNSIDLSKGAFLKIATEAEGMVPITWKFV